MKGADQCPRCASRAWREVGTPSPGGFYGADTRVCRNCKTAWEPIDPAELLDPKHEPLGAFKHPCNNCAFRKGSPEQRDKDDWAGTLYSLANGAGFYCHKGVPIDVTNVNGFAYPEDGKNPRKLRLCRGYLNSIVGPRLNPRLPAETADFAGDTPWVDQL